MPTTFADLEATYDGFYAPAFEIDISGGETFSTAEGRASSVTVRTAVDRTNRVSFSVGGVYDQSAGDFTGVESAGLEVGSNLTVKLGYGSTLETVMRGRITDVNPRFPEASAPTLDVVGHDHRWAMGRASGDRSWDGSTVTDVAESLARGYGFDRVETGPSGGAADLELEHLTKDAESDLAFLTRLAETFDYELFSRAGVLWFRRPPTDGSPALSLQYGRGLRSYQRRGSAGGEGVGTVTHRGVDHYTGKAVSGSATRAGGDAEQVRNAPMESDREAERRSAATATGMDRERRSTVTTLGLPDLRIGDWLALTGLGSVGGRSYDGTYYVQSVDHTVDRSGYTTSADVSGPRE